MEKKVIINKRCSILLILAFTMLLFTACGSREEKESDFGENNVVIEDRISILEQKIDSMEDLLIDLAQSNKEIVLSQNRQEQTGQNAGTNVVNENRTNNGSSGGSSSETSGEGNQGQNQPASGSDGEAEGDTIGSDENGEGRNDAGGEDSQKENSGDGTENAASTSAGNGKTALSGGQGQSEIITLTPSGIEIDFDAYLKEINELEEEVDKASVTTMETYHGLKRRIKAIEDKLDFIDDNLEEYYRSNKITKTQYSGFDSELDVLEDKLDRVEDRLEARFGIDD